MSSKKEPLPAYLRRMAGVARGDGSDPLGAQLADRWEADAETYEREAQTAREQRGGRS